jgi:formylglycine-generating enzyme required for sulfatase activity
MTTNSTLAAVQSLHGLFLGHVHLIYIVGFLLIAFGGSVIWMRSRPIDPAREAKRKRFPWGWLWLLAGIACLVTGFVRHLPIRSSPQPSVLLPQPPQTDPKKLTLNLGNGVQMDLVLIPAGEFVMGSPDTENGEDHSDSESPQHKVTITKPFYMGQYEVNQAQWMTVSGNQSNFKGDNLPAECVSWGDCQKFCEALSARTGHHVRLPSEAEWEYACRAGTKSVFAFGDSLSADQACFNGKEPYGGGAPGPARKQTMPVGSFKPNAFGLYDMHGNVWELCEDLYHPSYEGAPTDGSAWIQGGDPQSHVRRGGAYENAGSVCRSAVRYATVAETRAGDTGFRVVVDADAPAK